MIIHIVADTLIKGNGVHTAFLDHLHLLQAKEDVETVVNSDGWGDVMHSHSYGPNFFLKGLFYKGRKIHTVHVIPDSIKGSIPGWKSLMPVVNWYFRKVYSYADVCIAISPMVENAIRKTGATTEIVRIPNPIDLSVWKSDKRNRQRGREILGIGLDERVVLGVGQLQPRKGVEDFMEMAASLPNIRFVWVGGRPLRFFTEGVGRIDAQREKACENIQFTGMLDLDEMPLMYAAADTMVFPSYQENCPLAPIEAAACGLPVVFRDLREYKSLYEYPYLKAGSTDEFIQTIELLFSDQDFYRTATLLSQNLVRQFDKERVREKLMELYSQIQSHQRGLRTSGAGS